ncbi:MAG: hypothetical protein U9P10_10535 [Thermodesulfobacteriota bacterium]|nr:hypothetical protein [Thermodesulfobacteriota bacterium]
MPGSCGIPEISGKTTPAASRVEGDTAFLSALDSGRAVQYLVDDRFVLQAMDEAGGMALFCDCNMDFPYTREESVELI